jgi:transcriptional regulator with XRE-family HTH domain
MIMQMSPSFQTKASAVLANIRAQRLAKQYSQLYIATKLGITQNAYSKIELGYSSVTLNTLVRIGEILEVDLSELILVAPLLRQG